MKTSKILLLGLVLLSSSILPVSATENENVSKLIVQGDGKVSAAPDMVTIVICIKY